MGMRTVWVLAAAVTAATAAAADEMTAAQRGEKALLGRHFTPPTLPSSAYQNLWKVWGLKEPPADLHREVIARYGMHAPAYPNRGYPMGFREVDTLLGKMLSTDCMLCHAGSINGTSYVGLGNATFDYQSLTEDLAAALGLPAKTPFTFCNVRGTIEAGAFSVWLMGRRNPDLSLRDEWRDLKLRDDLCEDTPAWWLLKKKQTMYYTGSGHARSVRSLMQFMMSPLNSAESIKKEEATFRDIQAYILSIEAPKYPWKIDQDLAAKGKELFAQNCARCHGTYGARWSYPNKVIPLKEIGTDPTRYEGISEEFGRLYNQSWFAQENPGWFADEYKGRLTEGYQAPPLDGIWATAPYFHNGSAPTVYDVLNSKARPKVFTRSYRTDEAAYDKEKLGWKVQPVEKEAVKKMTGFEARKVYDTTLPGRVNGGHTFGDDLDDAERRAVIEYLKTL
jgi:mono/diheme cytochrome c family protein